MAAMLAAGQNNPSATKVGRRCDSGATFKICASAIFEPFFNFRQIPIQAARGKIEAVRELASFLHLEGRPGSKRHYQPKFVPPDRLSQPR